MTTSKPRLLLVDDDAAHLRTVELLLRADYSLKTATSVQTAKMISNSNTIDVAIVDLNFEGHEEDGLSLIEWLSQSRPALPIIVLSGDSNTKRVVSAMRLKLVNFIPKSSDYQRDLKVAIESALQKVRALKEADSQKSRFLTRSLKMIKILETLDLIVASESNCPILFIGESGTGKERIVAHTAERLRKKLVAANMASIPTDTAESELFGHVKGAFTGAHANKVGLIEQAHNGIFFLDELGDCPPAIQTKLLRVIQENEIQPLGGVSRKVSVRFIGATHRDLEEMSLRGTFRHDLHQRLNTFVVRIPPLRDRPEDIEFYTNQFLEELSPGEPLPVLSSGLVGLMSYTWPGNVRELRNVMERIVVLSKSRVLDAETVHDALGGKTSQYQHALGDNDRRAQVIHALEATHGNRSQAAVKMGIHPSTFFRLIKKFGIGEAVASKPGRPCNANQVMEAHQ